MFDVILVRGAENTLFYIQGYQSRFPTNPMPRVSDQFYQSDEDEDGDSDEMVRGSDSSPSEDEEIADEIGVCKCCPHAKHAP